MQPRVYVFYTTLALTIVGHAKSAILDEPRTLEPTASVAVHTGRTCIEVAPRMLRRQSHPLSPNLPIVPEASKSQPPSRGMMDKRWTGSA